VNRFGLGDGDRFGFLAGGSGLLLSATATARAAGGTLLNADAQLRDDSAATLAWLRDEEITALYLTAPVLRALAGSGLTALLPALRYVFLANDGGLTARDVELARGLAPACRVVALYRPGGGAQQGPLAAYTVPETWSPATAPLRVPIGTATAEPATLLNAAGRPAAVGEVAELCFGEAATGDLVRRRPDGLLEYAAPAVDLLDTVASLRDLPAVQDAVVRREAGPDGVSVLTAYDADPAHTLDVARLRQHLVTRLPEYLIPRQITVLERLPLTDHGEHDPPLPKEHA